MSIWKRPATLEQLNALSAKTLMDHIGIVYSAMTDQSLEATLTVNQSNRQPFGVLHGGASAAIIETLGSCASVLASDPDAQVVGTELNCSHLKAVPVGQTVRGICTPLRLGKSQHVWDVKIVNEADELCCVGRLTTRVYSGR